MKTLESDEIINKSKSERSLRKPGVYFLIKNNVIVYVGKGRLVWTRMSSHASHKNYDFDRFCVIECKTEKDAAALEAVYINKFLPKYNKTIEPIARYTEQEIQQALNRACFFDYF